MSRNHRDAGAASSSGASPSQDPRTEDVPDKQSAAAKKDTPDPDHAAKPDGPDDLSKPSWKFTLKRTLREFMNDQCMDLAAALTYWAVLAIAPALLALVSIIGLFSNPQQVVDQVMTYVEELAPGAAGGELETLVETVAQQESAGLAFVTGLLVALWSASGYVMAFSRAMNRMYALDEGRPFWKLRPIMLLVTLVLLVLVVVVVAALVLSGPVAAALGNVVGLSDQAVTVWNIAKWPVIVLLVALIIAILYYATPNVKMPKFRWLSVGSFVAILVWAVATLGFGLYVANFGNYDETYGALAGVILFLLWLWLTNNALLFGAELDSEMERARELQAGIEAEETLQLPPRDTAASEKRQEKIKEDIAAAKALRLSEGRTQDLDEVGKSAARR